MSTEVATKPILKWQREQIVKELLLLQAHISDPSCPCDTEGEFCVRKHLLTIEALCQETSAIADTDEEKTKLNNLAIEAKRLRTYEEKHICDEDVELDVDMEDWARSWRKQFEESSIACDIVAKRDVIPINYDGEESQIEEVAMSSPSVTEALIEGVGVAIGTVVAVKVLEKYKDKKGSNPLNPIALSKCEKEHGLGPRLNRCILKIEERNIDQGCPPMGLGTKKCPNPVAVCRASISQPICSVKVESPKASGEAIDLPEQWTQPRWCPGIAAADKELKQANKALTTTKSRITGIRKNLTTALNICAGQAEMFEQPIAVLDPYGSRCRDPETGLWAHSEECGFEPIGIKTTALGAGGLTHYEFEFHVVEGPKLVVSHDPFTFVPNPDYPKNLQPRLRERLATKAQVEKIAANIEPDALLTDFHVLDRGAPIIGTDLAVEAGNGRVMALLRAYEDHPESYRNYRDRLVERIRDFGLRAEDITGLSLPILVRVRLTEVDRTAFTQEANAMSTIAPSAIENARTDAEKITIVMIQELRVSEDESIEDALRADKNLPFARSFLQTLPEEVQASLVDAKGRLNRDGVHRMAMAIFVSAFQGDNGLRLAEKAFESIDMDIRNAVNAIARSLGAIAQAESLIRSGDRDSELTIGDDLAQAVSVYSAIKTTPALTVEKYLAQEQLFERELTDFQEGILILLERYRRSPKKLGRVFTAYAEGVIASPPPAQTAMFPEAKISKQELWEKAVGQAEREPEAIETPSLFQADQLLDEISHQICSMSSMEHGFTICSDKCRLLRGPESVGHKYGVTVDISCPEGAEPIGTYHSHPSDPTLSEQDITEMVRLDLPVACVGVPDNGVKCYLIGRCG